MPTNTINYQLKKPQDTDNADLKVFIGDNMDIIDTEMQKKADKTALSTHTTDTTIHVTSFEKTSWNGKASTSIVTAISNGLMISTDKSKLDGIATGANNYVHPANHSASIITQDSNNRFVTDTEKATWNSKADASSVYTKVETDTRIQNVIGSAPVALDTLKELATALGNDANFSATVTTQLSNKVDKVSGKQLSTEDYTTVEKTKLTGIATGANNYVHPATHAPSVIVQDASNRFVTDTEKSTWNGKASTAVVTTGANGLMIASDKSKLDGVATGANNYVHPTTAGNKHIPTGGEIGQVLTNSASGTAVWSTPSSSVTATSVSITDSGNYFTGVNTESALQEIGQVMNAMRGSLLTSANKLLES